MKAEIGDIVVRRIGNGADVLVLRVTRRSERNIATALGNDPDTATPMDQRKPLEHFRAYDKMKVERINQLAASIEDARQKAIALFQSLDRID